ncbi:phosphoribosyltransferase family protein [Crateriforma spongiae]|uniref:phosphoribosyltransferase family protein n=1 Tax=Crateriforma spongiae TaxID=2724528 RepID=UPI0014475D23
MILDVGSAELVDAAGTICQQVRSAGVSPSVVLGVLNGGRVPAEMLARELGSECRCVLHRRKTTGRVKSMAVSAVNRFPVFVGNVARVLEDRALRILSSASTETLQLRRELVDKLSWVQWYDLADKTPVLIVDDAVDSGRTVGEIVLALEHLGVSRSSMRIACVTVTRPDPVVDVDFFYKREVLCRFPWSDDAKSGELDGK